MCVCKTLALNDVCFEENVCRQYNILYGFLNFNTYTALLLLFLLLPTNTGHAVGAVVVALCYKSIPDGVIGIFN
jgi:hypothetical protein